QAGVGRGAAAGRRWRGGGAERGRPAGARDGRPRRGPGGHGGGVGGRRPAGGRPAAGRPRPAAVPAGRPGARRRRAGRGRRGAALTALVTMARGRRSWAVLGHMAELGPDAPAEHEALGRIAAALGVDRLVLVGAEAEPIGAGATAGSFRGETVHVPDVPAAIR